MNDQALLARLGYSFADPELLRQALTHRSHSSPHNERLEFLGDSVLNCVVARMVYQAFPRLPEGDLSRLRAHLVNQQTLFSLAQDLGLGERVRLGEGEVKSGGFRRPSILADALEAVFGAIFLDGGFEQAQRVIEGVYDSTVRELDPVALGKDPKTLLQEYLQSRRIALPRYNVVATRGEAHQQQFEVECVIPELQIRCLGEGTSRRSAEQNAAREAYAAATRA
ncbi:MAG: ribonuclease III [Betaproteobacteria bacterium]|nr:ribonuclease III [Betaproteobacteria bacterium]